MAYLLGIKYSIRICRSLPLVRLESFSSITQFPCSFNFCKSAISFQRKLVMEANVSVDPPTLQTKKTRLLYPPLNPGLKILDKSAFTKEVSVPIIFVHETSLPIFTKAVKSYFLKLRKFQPVQEDPSQIKTKKVYLNPELVPDVTEFLNKLSNSERTAILSATNEIVTFSYENWKWDEILDSIIPDDLEKIGSYTTVGSLIHLNLREHLLPYKVIIGEVLLDNVHQAKTVVNKIQTIDNTYRNFQMEVIAGEPNTIVKLKENNVEFEFDFATVYWNSRLSSEHERIVKGFLNSGDILFDVFAGVGPFAIPAAKKKCFVYANDLNPESYRWLAHNVTKHKKAEPYIKTFNQDGRDFIRSEFPKLVSISDPPVPSSDFKNFTSSGKIHVTMNLPALAVEFLDSFWGLVDEEAMDKSLTVVIHVYCFVKGLPEDDLPKMAKGLVRENLRHDLPEHRILEVFFVRNVAPNKNMYRISFTLPPEILTSTLPPLAVKLPEVILNTSEEVNASGDNPESKRLKLDSSQQE